MPFSSSLSVLKTDDFLWICVQCPDPPACVAGTYSGDGKNGGGDRACQPCPAGTFQNETGSSSECTDCVAGKYAREGVLRILPIKRPVSVSLSFSLSLSLCVCV